MKKQSLILILFLFTVTFGYYYSLTTNFGDGILSGLTNITLIIELSAIFFFLFITTWISTANIHSSTFSIKALIWPCIGLLLSIYFWIDNGHVSPAFTFGNDPGNYSEFTLVFLPSILFVIISQLITYFHFRKNKSTNSNFQSINNPKPGTRNSEPKTPN